MSESESDRQREVPRRLHHVDLCIDCTRAIRVYTPRRIRRCVYCIEQVFRHPPSEAPLANGASS